MRATLTSMVLLVAALAIACGGETINIGGDGGTGADGNNNNNGGDGSTGQPDAGFTADCAPNNPQCSNCIDDDGDGLIDGFDPHCVSALDDDESSFATGIPGDNVDRVWQDCFFDGDSGHGNDGCNQHVCCILGATSRDECPSNLRPQQFDPDNCGLTQECIDNCGAITPPGCDCFGCCTICWDGQCHDVYINQTVAPECDVDVLGDPDKCPTCQKAQDCNSECDPGGCILCPGQTYDDLPAHCDGANECPTGSASCEYTSDCGSNQFCASGCCIAQVN